MAACLVSYRLMPTRELSFLLEFPDNLPTLLHPRKKTKYSGSCVRSLGKWGEFRPPVVVVEVDLLAEVDVVCGLCLPEFIPVYFF